MDVLKSICLKYSFGQVGQGGEGGEDQREVFFLKV